MFKIIIKITIEILIALGLFVILVRYTTIFDNVFDNVGNKGNIKNTNKKNIHGIATDISNTFVKKIQKQLELKDKTDNNILYKKTKENGKRNESDSFILKENKERISCELPRSNEKIKDGYHIIAYKENIANNENICIGEIRICNNGQLLGGYQYPECNYTIDGINNGKEVVKGATQTNHTLFTFIKGSEWAKSLIQPDRYNYPNKNKTKNIYNLRGHRVNILKNEGNTYRNETTNKTENYYIEEVIGNIEDKKLKGCFDLDGKAMKHGDFIIAYKNKYEEAPNLCIFEKRYCNNGKLEGNRENKNCEQKTYKNLENNTKIKYNKNGKIIKINKINVINETIDPKYIKTEKNANYNLDSNCNGNCYIINTKEKKYEDICKTQYLNIKSSNIENRCLDKSCYELKKKYLVKLKNSNIKTGNIEVIYLGDNNEILGKQNKQIGLNQGINIFEYLLLNGTKEIKLKVEYNNLCKKGIIKEKTTYVK